MSGRELRRVHVTESFGQAERISLSQETSRHLRDVLRLNKGDHLRLFNDRGEWAEAEILGAEGDHLVVKVLRRLEGTGLLPSIEITLCPAVMKGGRMDWVVEKASEIGVRTLKPVLTERTVVKDPGTGKVSRWRRLAVASAEQSGRGAPLVIEAPASLTSVLDQVSGDHQVLLFHTEGRLLSLDDVRETNKIAVFTGPEGGFSTDEIETAKLRKANIVRLDSPVLRADTAAFTAAWTALLLASIPRTDWR